MKCQVTFITETKIAPNGTGEESSGEARVNLRICAWEESCACLDSSDRGELSFAMVQQGTTHVSLPWVSHSLELNNPQIAIKARIKYESTNPLTTQDEARFGGALL